MGEGILYKETEELRSNQQYILLVLDGYAAHVQYPILSMLKVNRIIVIALPSQSSHVMQPLYVSVLGTYNSFLQAELQRASRTKRDLNAFDIALCIRNAYSRSHVAAIIVSGFARTGLSDPSILFCTFKPLKVVLETHVKTDMGLTVDRLMQSFRKRDRSVLRDSQVEQNGHIRIDTRRGAHPTSEMIAEALKEREKRKEQEAAD